jgi:uncharacterized phage-associated protein
MARAHDVAAHILQKLGSMSSMKLQKLVYYSQAWHLVWDEEPLFDEKIEAWANGPVVYELFDHHRGAFTVGPPWQPGDPSKLEQHERETIDVVLDGYGSMSGRQLSVLTHSEGPWKDARGDLPANARSSNEITHAALYNYYSWVEAEAGATNVDGLDWGHD